MTDKLSELPALYGEPVRLALCGPAANACFGGHVLVCGDRALRELALQDGSPEVRFLALQALGVSPEVGSVARLALNDADSHVRTKAQEILLQLEDGTQAQPPDQSTQGQ